MRFEILNKKLKDILNTIGNQRKNDLPPLKVKRTEEFYKAIRELDLFESVCVVGDYDVDGVMATSIAVKCLKKLGFRKVSAIIPNRFKDGYGLSKGVIDRAYKNGVKTIITVDNGIREYDNINYAKSLGFKVIITDHHTPPQDRIPKADLVICSHFGKGVEICGARLIYELFKPLIRNKISILEENELKLFAGFATIADSMPIINENYDLLGQVIEIIKTNSFKNEGLSNLLEQLKVNNKYFDAETIGFSIAPCLNASGRLDTAYWSLEAMLKGTEDSVDKLIEFNSKRKELTHKHTEKAKEKIKESDFVNVIYLDKIEEGIVGIVAGKIAEATDKPTFIFTKSEDGHVKGSGRTPTYFNLIEGCSFLNNKDYSVKFGGHSGAMGLTLRDKECLKDFKKELEKEVSKCENRDTLITSYEWLEEFELFKTKELLEIFAPYGFMNEEPLFHKRVKLEKVRAIGEFKNHYMFFTELNGEKIKCTYFFAEKELEEGKTYDIFFNIKREEKFGSNGEEVITAKIKYIE